MTFAKALITVLVIAEWQDDTVLVETLPCDKSIRFTFDIDQQKSLRKGLNSDKVLFLPAVKLEQCFQALERFGKQLTELFWR